MKIEIDLEEIADVVADRVRSQVLAMLQAATQPAVAEAKFSVYLEFAGEKKIEVIKMVRAITGLGLKEAKDLVESARITSAGDGAAVVRGISKDDADKIAAQLEAVGAFAEVYQD